ncbi:MAG: sulfatase-like hydrolase/transferase [Bacilli bacterium]|nr:sulfatase-like hydrolase/transferase [Bacilli bacterium]
MKKRRYHSFVYVIGFLIMLRVVLNITVGISIFNFGILFDAVLMMFWVGIFAFFIKNVTIQKIYYIVVIVICSVFTIGDSVYYDYFGTISARSSFNGLQWLAEGNTLEYDIQIPLVAYLITPLILIVIYLIISNKEKDVFHIRDFAILSSVFLVQIILFLVWGNYNFETRSDYYRSDAYLFESMYDRSKFSEKYGYYNYHILDFTRIRPKLDKEELYAKVDAYFEEKTPHETNAYSDIYAGYNLITMTVETLETRFIDETLTPNLYMIQQNGFSFSNFYTTVFQQGATCNSEYMSIVGQSAITTNDWSNNICDAYSENSFTYSLANQLNNDGYHTYYFHSGYEWFYNRQTIVPQYGFETVKFQEDLFQLGYDDFNDRFDTQMMYFLDEFVDFNEPFYIDMLTYSMHGAYNQTEFDIHNDRVEAAYPNIELDPEIRNYMEKLVEFDNLIGLIMQKLEENNQLDNTLFVIYPDHYPYMMNSETYSAYIGIEEGSHEISRQQLLIYATNMNKEIIANTGSTMDIAPTILNLIDSSSEFKYFMGTDLLAGITNYVLFSDLTITDGENYLYINEDYIGNQANYALLELALEDKISELELQKKLLNIDYFKMLAERD